MKKYFYILKVGGFLPSTCSVKKCHIDSEVYEKTSEAGNGQSTETGCIRGLSADEVYDIVTEKCVGHVIRLE